MDKRIKETIRYLGYGKNVPDTGTLRLIDEMSDELSQIAKPLSIHRVYGLWSEDGRHLSIGNLKVESLNLARNLAGCRKAILFAATLGVGTDRLIHKYEVLDMPGAVVLQAAAAAYLEEYCDSMQEELAEKYAKDGMLCPRFSPGYGDFSIFHQKDILGMLDAGKQIGLTMTESYMLVPAKSVTAVIGIRN